MKGALVRPCFSISNLSSQGASRGGSIDSRSKGGTSDPAVGQSPDLEEELCVL